MEAWWSMKMITKFKHIGCAVRSILNHDDVIKWKHFPRYWPFVGGIHRSPVNSPHKGQRRGALVFSLTWVRNNSWINNGDAGDLRCHRAHYDVIVMFKWRKFLQTFPFQCIHNRKLHDGFLLGYLSDVTWASRRFKSPTLDCLFKSLLRIWSVPTRCGHIMTCWKGIPEIRLTNAKEILFFTHIGNTDIYNISGNIGHTHTYLYIYIRLYTCSCVQRYRKYITATFYGWKIFIFRRTISCWYHQSWASVRLSENPDT